MIIRYYYFLSYVFLLMLLACGSPKSQNMLAPVSQNGLSAAERAVGWFSLFDGESMNQWRVFNEEGLRGWKVEQGSMIAQGIDMADIITKDTFSDFELKLDWKVSEGANSGIFFNVREGEDLDAVYVTGPEYQLLDDHAYPDKNKILCASANYDVHPPAKDVTRPCGVWNTSRLIVDNGHVEHWLNGQRTVAYDLYSEDWRARVAGSKRNDVDTYAKYSSGHIALQDHGGTIWFRNIKIRRL